MQGHSIRHGKDMNSKNYSSPSYQRENRQIIQWPHRQTNACVTASYAYASRSRQMMVGVKAMTCLCRAEVGALDVTLVHSKNTETLHFLFEVEHSWL